MLEENDDFRLEINEFADQEFEEFIKQKGGFKPLNTNNKEVQPHQNVQNHVQSGASLPDSVDWRKIPSVLSPVQNQGSCGSCWAFSATCAIESGYALSTSTPVLKLSEQELVNCEKTDYGCNGGLMDHAFAWAEDNGMTTESEIPYTGEDGTCDQNKKDAKVFVKGQVDVDGTDEALMEAVSKAPVAIGVAANISWQLQFGGTIKAWMCGAGQLNHGVVLVGQTKDKWIVRNSWGEGWGNQGQVQLEKGKNTCGIRNSASYPTFDSSIY